MVKRKLKKPVIYVIYGIAVITLIGSIYLIERNLSNNIFEKDDDYDYVSDSPIDNDIPVVEVDEIVMRPYTNQDIKIVKNFYDYKGDAKEQEKSLIYYQNTYLQNSGISYGGKEKFNVVSILDGTVINVKEDPLLGKMVEIKHDNNMISVYQSLSEVLVKKDDVLKQGTVIGKSGMSNISSDLGDHLYFELIYKGQNVNPENYYDKKVSDL